MPLTNADHQRAFRQRRDKRIAKLISGYEKIVAEIGDPKGEKGKRILEIARDALA